MRPDGARSVFSPRRRARRDPFHLSQVKPDGSGCTQYATGRMDVCRRARRRDRNGAMRWNTGTSIVVVGG
ncbi:hypothetical protein GSH03_26250 [Burkholderia pseudomallei]|nr:hypothetical protein [Burkholderia pseudomallei]